MNPVFLAAGMLAGAIFILLKGSTNEFGTSNKNNRNDVDRNLDRKQGGLHQQNNGQSVRPYKPQDMESENNEVSTNLQSTVENTSDCRSNDPVSESDSAT